MEIEKNKIPEHLLEYFEPIEGGGSGMGRNIHPT